MDVFVTGTGVISPVGLDVESFYGGLDRGECAIDRPDWANRPEYQHVERVWGAIVRDFRPQEYLSGAVLAGTDRFAQYGLAAAIQAVDQAGLELPPLRTATVFGTSMGGVRTLLEAQEALSTHGPEAVDKKLHIRAWPNMLAAQVAMHWQLHGPLLTVSAACASSLDAIGLAADMIRSGRADVAIVGGADCGLTPLGWYGAQRYGMSRPSADPGGFCKPFDVARAGTAEGEGSGAVVLESAEHLERRGGRPLARVAGYGSVSDGTHPSRPEPSGMWEARTMAMALESGGLSADDIDVVVAHATGTPMGDLAEIRALNSVFAEREDPVLATSIKGGAGHAGGGAGVQGVLAGMHMIESNTAIHSVGTDDVEPECRFQVVTERPIAADVQRVLVNGFGFGGQNASIVVEGV